jgi:hypothetical protein
LESFLRSLAQDPLRRNEFGARSRAFLQSQWSEAVFAERFARVVTGDIPSDWWVPVENVHYLHGMGMEEGEARQIIRGLVDQFGSGALQVNHLPQLREKLVAFGKGGPAGY